MAQAAPSPVLQSPCDAQNLCWLRVFGGGSGQSVTQPLGHPGQWVPQVPWVQEQLLAHLDEKSKALRSLFSSPATLGAICDKVGCGGEWAKQGGVGRLQCPWAEPVPCPHSPLPPLGQYGWSSTGRGGQQHLWWGGGKSCQNVTTSQAETVCLKVAFLGRREHLPALPSPRSAEVLSSRAPQCLGQVSGRVPWGRQCPNWGAAAKP